MNFKTISVSTRLWVSTIPNHHEIKQSILSAISSMGTHNLIEKQQNISNTDWHLRQNINRPYWQIVFPLLKEHHGRIEQEFNSPMKLQIGNYWFQQYAFGDYHDWHIHDLIFSNIYYVELPANTVTTFKSGQEEFTVDVKEGDIITFPSTLEHCSKPNQSSEVKTIVSYNSCLI